MSMIKCHECNNEMSNTAPTCPKCGKPNVDAPIAVKPVSLLLGIGIFLIPGIFSWFTLRKGHTIKAKVISFLWLTVCLAVFISAGNGSKLNRTSTITLPSQIKAEQIMQVNIHEILSAYKNNEIGADNKYKGKLIQVTGKIGSIKKDILDNLYVTLGTGKFLEIPQIQAFFNDSKNNQLAQLRKGHQLTIVGRVDGLMMNVLMNGCIIK